MEQFYKIYFVVAYTLFQIILLFPLCMVGFLIFYYSTSFATVLW